MPSRVTSKKGQRFDFYQPADNLYEGVAFSWHFGLSFRPDPNINIGSVFWGQVGGYSPPDKPKFWF
jgi:hypothetical protein